MSETKNGVVLEIHGRRAIVLTGQGQFQRIRLRVPAHVGEVVPIHLQQSAQFVTRWRIRSTIAGLAAAVVICAGVLHAIFIAPPQAEAYAFVSLDIEPSVSFELNNHMTVIRAQANDANGKQLLRSVHVKGQSLNSAIHQIVTQVASKGLLPSHDTIIVAASSKRANGDVSNVESQATADVNNALKSLSPSATKGSVQVYSIQVPSSVWDQAVKKKVSPGKYATYLLATELGVPVQLKDINSANLQLVLAQAHDLQTGVGELDTGNYNQVAAIVSEAEGVSGQNGGSTPPPNNQG